MRAALRSFPVSQRFFIFVFFFKKYPYLFRACVSSLSFFTGLGMEGWEMLEQGGRGREAEAGGRGKKANCRLLLVFLSFSFV